MFLTRRTARTRAVAVLARLVPAPAVWLAAFTMGVGLLTCTLELASSFFWAPILGSGRPEACRNSS